MRGHCSCKALESFPDRHSASGDLMGTCLGTAAAHEVQHLLPLTSGNVVLKLACEFREFRLSL